jgi:hypothetical protein
MLIKMCPVICLSFTYKGSVGFKILCGTQQIFGAKSAVPNFDRLGHTIFTLAAVKSKMPMKFLHRTLDDVSVVSPHNVVMGETFVKTYVELCSDINIDMTSTCPKFEKAFVNSSFGKVLGIFFYTDSLSWKLPDDKREKTAKSIQNALQNEVTLKEFQELMGRLNFAGQLSPFMQGFRYNLNRTLSNLQNGNKTQLSGPARADLEIWANFILDEDQWNPLVEPHFNPPLAYDCFVSDAAGCSEHTKVERLVGCGNIGMNCDGEIIFASQLFWPPGVLQNSRDEAGKLYGHKTTTLEFLGILVPFLLILERVKNSYAVVMVDNTSCFYGWLNRQSPGD